MSEPSAKLEVDFKGAIEKTSKVRQLPAAFKHNVRDWSSQTVRYIKQRIRGGGGFFRRTPIELSQRLGQRTEIHGEKAVIVLGTGTQIGRAEVVYAAIQERGGWIVPKKRRALTIPFPGVKGSANQYRANSFILRRPGQEGGIIATTKGKRGRIVPLFLLRTSVLLPARRWFSTPIAERQPALNVAISEEMIWATAAQLAYKRTPEQGGE